MPCRSEHVYEGGVGEVSMWWGGEHVCEERRQV